MCEAIQQSGDVRRLANFLWKLPADLLCQGESVLRARALVAFHHGNYKDLYSILEGHIFDQRYHGELQQVPYPVPSTQYPHSSGLRSLMREIGGRIDIVLPLNRCGLGGNDIETD